MQNIQFKTFCSVVKIEDLVSERRLWYEWFLYYIIVYYSILLDFILFHSTRFSKRIVSIGTVPTPLQINLTWDLCIWNKDGGWDAMEVVMFKMGVEALELWQLHCSVSPPLSNETHEASWREFWTTRLLLGQMDEINKMSEHKGIRAIVFSLKKKKSKPKEHKCFTPGPAPVINRTKI